MRSIVVRVAFVVASSLVALHAVRAAPPSVTVEVENTWANPVPVVVGNTAAAPVPVVLGNTAAAPLPVSAASAAPQIVQDILVLSIGSNTRGATSAEIPVPAGKVLVFDHVSAEANCEQGQTAFLELEILNPSRTSAGAFRLPPTGLGAYPLIEGEAAREHLVFSLPIRVYVKPGGVFYFGAVRSATAGSCAFFISYSAHYVDSS